MKGLMASAKARTITVAAFLLLGVSVIVTLLTATGLNMPFLEDLGEYNVTLQMNDVDNLVEAGRVRIAGVEVGEVQTIDVQPGGAKVVISLHPRYAPLHQGATVWVGNKSLVEETYLGVKDGTGAAIPNGGSLPAQAVLPSTQLRDVMYSLDGKTRADMGALLLSSGKATEGTKDDVAGIFSGLGNLGRQGYDALDAVAAQGAELRSLARESTTLLRSLDTGRGQIATMVDNADRLTQATASQRSSIEGTVRRLPGVLDSASTATVKLTELSHSLGPVAHNLEEAGPDLSDALHNLPGASDDLRGLLPALDDTLGNAPRTLRKVPDFGDDLRDLIPDARDVLRDANPMLRYLKPYGPEIGAWFAGFNSAAQYTDEAGKHYFKLMPIQNDAMLQVPVDPGSPGAYKNAIPPPGSGGTPGPFKGQYPRVEREPR